MHSLFKSSLCLISCLLLTGCEPPYNTTPQIDTGPRQTVASALIRWNQKQPIRLQKHQLIPIDYLEKNPNIKGLIINHYLGTGKTFLAIGFAERNQERPVIILAPKFLHSHWLDQLDKYGVKDKSRYQFVSHTNPEKLLQKDLSNSVIIVDESHRLIERVRANNTSSPTYSQLYCKLRQAHRILALTGTPIYNDTFDLVYQINLVAGKNVFSFNQEEFRSNFSKIHTANAFWRGHVLESLYLPKLTGVVLPIFAGFYLHNPFMVLIGPFITPMAGVPLLKYLLPASPNALRDFSPNKLRNAIQHYISYYNFEHDSRFYPSQCGNEKELSYNEAQLHFLYRYYDSRLNTLELTYLLKDDIAFGSKSQQEYISLNSSLIQNLHKQKPGAGREIGNLPFTIQTAPSGRNDHRQPTQHTVIFPRKFEKILNTIQESPGPAVLYSHYYHNGILPFKQFLDTSGYQGRYRIFHPDMSKDEHAHIIQEFNNNKVKILLLHPDITEGISLKGTRQLHFLETPINNAARNQIVGRAIRYRSHIHLPKNEQRVDVYNWKQVLFLMDFNAHKMLRNNWHHNFSELNYYSEMGEGRRYVDKNATLKSQSPDTNAYQHLNTVNHQVETFRQYVKTFSIEKAIYRTN